jgi:hypothetical protein
MTKKSNLGKFLALIRNWNLIRIHFKMLDPDP